MLFSGVRAPYSLMLHKKLFLRLYFCTIKKKCDATAEILLLFPNSDLNFSRKILIVHGVVSFPALLGYNKEKKQLIKKIKRESAQKTQRGEKKAQNRPPITRRPKRPPQQFHEIQLGGESRKTSDSISRMRMAFFAPGSRKTGMDMESIFFLIERTCSSRFRK